MTTELTEDEWREATTYDPFTEAARAEAERRHPDSVDVETGEPVDDWGFEEQGRRDFRDGAEWARGYLAAQEPTDAEVEAALTALLISESIALGQTADEAADYAIRELETRDLTNLRTGVRCALRYARAARRDEEKR